MSEVDELEFMYNAPCRGGCGRQVEGKAIECADGHVEHHTPEGWLRVGLAVYREGGGQPRVHMMHFCEACSEAGRLGPALEEATNDLRGLGHLRRISRRKVVPLRPCSDDDDTSGPREVA